jgi:ABC-type dipeptide/oligopeptide/nickel transport system permease subunit
MNKFRKFASRSTSMLIKYPAGAISGSILLAFLVAGLASSVIAPFGPDDQNAGSPLTGPTSVNPFGVDQLGRDVLSRVIDAAKVAMPVSIFSVAMALVVGGLIGVIAGYTGGWVDRLLSRLMDVIFAFPALLLAIILVAVLSPALQNAIIAIAIVYTPRFARVARGSTLTVKNLEFIDAARLAGVSSARIAVRHVLPNILTPLVVLAALSMSTAQLTYAALSFLGLGASPPQADYGSMLAKATDSMSFAPWLVIFPAIALVILIGAFNFLGDAARDALDPRSSYTSGSRRRRKLHLGRSDLGAEVTTQQEPNSRN